MVSTRNQCGVQHFNSSPHRSSPRPGWSQRKSKLKCRVCNVRLSGRTSKLRHEKAVHGIERFTCPVCHLQFQNKTCYVFHLKSTHGANLGQKPLIRLGKKLPSVSKNKSSKRATSVLNGTGTNGGKLGIIQNSTSVNCTICKLPFKTKRNARRHEKVHENGRYLCAICGVPYKLRPLLTRHLRLTHKLLLSNYVKKYVIPFADQGISLGFSDDEVSYIAYGEYARKNKIKTNSVIKSAPGLSVVNGCFYKCNHCTRKFRRRRLARRHIAVHEKGDHFCLLCGAPYKYLATLTVHLKFEHDVSKRCYRSHYLLPLIRKLANKHMEQMEVTPLTKGPQDQDVSINEPNTNSLEDHFLLPLIKKLEDRHFKPLEVTPSITDVLNPDLFIGETTSNSVTHEEAQAPPNIVEIEESTMSLPLPPFYTLLKKTNFYQPTKKSPSGKLTDRTCGTDKVADIRKNKDSVLIGTRIMQQQNTLGKSFVTSSTELFHDVAENFETNSQTDRGSDNKMQSGLGPLEIEAFISSGFSIYETPLKQSDASNAFKAFQMENSPLHLRVPLSSGSDPINMSALLRSEDVSLYFPGEIPVSTNFNYSRETGQDFPPDSTVDDGLQYQLKTHSSGAQHRGPDYEFSNKIGQNHGNILGNVFSNGEFCNTSSDYGNLLDLYTSSDIEEILKYNLFEDNEDESLLFVTD